MLMAEDYINGQVILIDKPLQWTSFQVVNKIRWALKKQFNLKKIKVGHAGTLDPLATGLLIICTGKMTKEIRHFQSLHKTYTGQITLGTTTPSYDLETQIEAHFPTSHITEDIIYSTANQFVGKLKQYPPKFSAIKKDGKRLYELARKGEDVTLHYRDIEIFEFNIIAVNKLKAAFKVVCSKGTYIRSLAHDFGKALNSGAYLSALRRTQIGNFSVENALSPEQFVIELSK